MLELVSLTWLTMCVNHPRQLGVQTERVEKFVSQESRLHLIARRRKSWKITASAIGRSGRGADIASWVGPKARLTAHAMARIGSSAGQDRRP